MIRVPNDCDEFLQDQLPNGWRSASTLASELARRLEFLPWPDRTRIIDEFIWMRARSMLSNEEITAVINRQPIAGGANHAILEYSTFCSALVSSILLLLHEEGPIRSAPEAMTFMLSRFEAHQEMARTWISEAGGDPLQSTLARLPGYAFVVLTVYPNDSAESFLARDAFWQAMLGR